MPIAATVNTTGGGDAIVLQPRGVLDARTGYIFQLSDRVTDQGGNCFIPFTSTFSTGDFTNLKIDPALSVCRDQTAGWSGPPISSLVFGPTESSTRQGLMASSGAGARPRSYMLHEEQWTGLAGRP
jgi:hypothetical protein